MGPVAPLPEGVVHMLGPYLGRQRWYAGDTEPTTVHVVESRRLATGRRDDHVLWWAIVESDGARYQLLVGERPDGETADFLSGHENGVLGSAHGSYFYDAALDPELSLPLLGLVSDGVETPERVRPITAEQSNTSLVYDDRVIMKVFRRLLDGPNPDVEVTTALAAAGFEQVAKPVASWREAGVDLMFAQQYLAGGSEGWALALTSLRDFYSEEVDDPGEAGGDFASEAGRLGRMTARMHLVLASTYGVDDAVLPGGAWSALLDDIERRLARVGAGGGRSGAGGVDGGGTGGDGGGGRSGEGGSGGGGRSGEGGSGAGGSGEGDAGNALVARAVPVLARLRAVEAPGVAIRVHGDYHLGQVMRTDPGWYVLDFEGEPARSLDDRIRMSSPLKDVTGMLRSLPYATRFALRERAEREMERLEGRAEVWERHNRDAFLAGYHAEEGIAGLLPSAASEAAVSDAYELDKALYELDYERSYRPDWTDIPLGAIRRIVDRLAS